MGLSLVVITLNEERNLDRCLSSVAGLVDEIVVVDSGSRDGTAAIARRHGARFEVCAWRGHRAQKQHALSLASHEWVLSLDADEWLDAEAVKAVRAAVDGAAAGYRLDRWTMFVGRFVHAWSPEPMVRLFRREAGRFGGVDPHDVVQVDGVVGALPGRLLHESYTSLGQYRERSSAYAVIAASSAFACGRRFGWARLIGSPVGAALRKVGHGAWRDGWRGVVIVLGAARYSFGKQWALRQIEARGVPSELPSEHAGRVPVGPIRQDSAGLSAPNS